MAVMPLHSTRGMTELKRVNIETPQLAAALPHMEVQKGSRRGSCNWGSRKVQKKLLVLAFFFLALQRNTSQRQSEAEHMRDHYKALLECKEDEMKSSQSSFQVRIPVF